PQGARSATGGGTGIRAPQLLSAVRDRRQAGGDSCLLGEAAARLEGTLTGSRLMHRGGVMELVERVQDGGVLTLTLNRPDALNAFTHEMLRHLGEALRDAERDGSVRAVVITGAGRGFCAGQDLKEIEGGDTSFRTVLDGYNPVIRRIADIDKKVIAGVTGDAAGAGFSLALACDYRLASDAAVFVTTYARIGLTADSGMSYFLPRI